MSILRTTHPSRQVPEPGPSPSGRGRDAAAGIILPIVSDWQLERQFIHEVAIGVQTELLRRFVAEAAR